MADLAGFLSAIGEGPLRGSNNWEIVDVFTENLQKDGSSCGVFALIFAQALVQELEDWNRIFELSSERAREIIAEQLLAGELIPIAEDIASKK